MKHTKIKPMSKAKQDELLAKLKGNVKAAWSGLVDGEIEQVSDDPNEIFHNIYLKQPCPCDEFRERRGVNYCKKCFPLAGDMWSRHDYGQNEEWSLVSAHYRNTLLTDEIKKAAKKNAKKAKKESAT